MNVMSKITENTEEKYAIDLGTHTVGTQIDFKLPLLKPTHEADLKSGCWCASAKAKDQEVSIAIYIKGNPGETHVKTLKNGTYTDGVKYIIQVTYKVK